MIAAHGKCNVFSKILNQQFFSSFSIRNEQNICFYYLNQKWNSKLTNYLFSRIKNRNSFEILEPIQQNFKDEEKHIQRIFDQLNFSLKLFQNVCDHKWTESYSAQFWWGMKRKLLFIKPNFDQLKNEFIQQTFYKIDLAQFQSEMERNFFSTMLVRNE